MVFLIHKLGMSVCIYDHMAMYSPSNRNRGRKEKGKGKETSASIETNVQARGVGW